MKMFLTLLAIISLQTTFAQDTTVTHLKDGDLNLSKAHTQIISIKEICPIISGRMSCMAYGSIVKVKITFNGCVDNFGGYFSSFKVHHEVGTLSFGAINIANEDSQVTRCVLPPTKTIAITVPFEGTIILDDLTYTPAIMPKL